jgi:hypothetical protein
MKRSIFATFLSLLFAWNLSAQSAKQGNLLDEVKAMTSLLPASKSEGFVKPTAQELSDWRQLVGLLMDKKIGEARIWLGAQFPTYEWITFTDTGFQGKTYEIIREKATSTKKGWGALVYNPNKTRDLVFEAPHPIFDQNTDLESADLFRRLGAWFVFIAGTHRCANAEKTTCSGTSASCSGVTEAYPISDIAHFTASTFQATHEEIVKRAPKTYTISIHGHGDTDCPDFFLSSGVPTDPKPLVLQLKSQLNTSTLTAEYAGDGVTKCSLSGGTNTQGRFSNASTNACTVAATQASGYFMHIEQSNRVRTNSANYLKLADALQGTIPTAIEEETAGAVISFEAFPNPSNHELTIQIRSDLPAEFSLSIQNILGQKVAPIWQNQTVQGTKQVQIEIGQWASGIYHVVLENDKWRKTIPILVVH